MSGPGQKDRNLDIELHEEMNELVLTEKPLIQEPVDGIITDNSNGSTTPIENNTMFQLYGRTLAWARTFVHFFMFVTMGLIVAIPGPTLLDLKHISHANENIATIYTARSIGYLSGSTIGGIILDCMKYEEKALIGSSLLIAIGAYAIPWCNNLTLLLGAFLLTGLAMGFTNTGCNAACLRIWGKKSAPILQGLHFCYGLGGFLAPLLAAPFLSNLTPITDLTLGGLNQNITAELEAVVTTTFPGNSSDLRIIPSEKDDGPGIIAAYSIVGLFATFASSSFAFVYMLCPKKAVEIDQVKVNVRDSGLAFTILVVVIACFQTGLTTGIEVSFTQMLTTYAVNSVHNMSKASGSLMTSLYWGAFTLARVISIFLTVRVSEFTLLTFDFFVTSFATIFMLSVATWYQPALWIGTAVLGFGIASVFPATLSLLNKYIKITNKIAAAFTVVSSIIEMCVPLTLSYYIKSKPDALFYFLCVAAVSCSIIFGILYKILTHKNRQYGSEVPSTSSSQSDTNESSLASSV